MTALHPPVPPNVVDRATEFPGEVLCLMTHRPRDYIDIRDQYRHDIKTGRILACEDVRLAIEREDADQCRERSNVAVRVV
jgi:hypothetical protein